MSMLGHVMSMLGHVMSMLVACCERGMSMLVTSRDML